jgi:hypothetical protein
MAAAAGIIDRRAIKPPQDQGDGASVALFV